MAEEKDDKPQSQRKPIHGLGLRYDSRHVHADITIPAGIFRRTKDWLDENWKLAVWRSGITTVLVVSVFNGVSVRNMTITDKHRLEVLEKTAVSYTTLETRVSALEVENTIRKQINEEDSISLEKQAQQERNRIKRLQLEERNRARAEKLRKIGQANQSDEFAKGKVQKVSKNDSFFADPILPPSGNFPKRN